jgi:hypothetical protein
MTETPAKKAAPSAAAVEKPRQTLTDSMSQPPGVKERRSRRVSKKSRTGPFVKYVGHASQRVIRTPDWNSLNFQEKAPNGGFKTVSWDLKNDFMVESEKFTDEQLDYLLVDDVQGNGAHSFLEVDYDENGQLVQVVEDEDEE